MEEMRKRIVMETTNLINIYQIDSHKNLKRFSDNLSL